jgi:ABC-2 type transport system ATP-binding protein
MGLMGYAAVQIEHIAFNYPSQNEMLFTDLNLQIEDGERFGLFGPNGAGKTTLMSLMTGMLDYDKGSIKIFGNTVNGKNKKVNKLFGYVPQDFSFYEELSPVENLDFFGAWAGLSKVQTKKRTDELLTIMGLNEVRNKAIATFSGGMKRKVNLAIAVLHQPKILFLDEPTVGVDVQTRHEIINYLKQLNSNGTTLIYTSHQLNEAQTLCNKVALIDDGKIIACNHLDALLAEYKQEKLEGLFLYITGKDFNAV